MMTDADKITILVGILEGGNAASFARRCGIRQEVLSRARNRETKSRTIFPRILAAYPSVNKEWLITGEGEPVLTATINPSELKELSEKVDRLTRAVEALIKRLG